MAGGFDVVVVGGGVIGCGIAYELTTRGQRVALVERGKIGGEASWASAGIISLPNKTNMAPERIEITRRGHQVYPELIARLEAETGYAIEYRPTGIFTIGVDAAQGAAVDELAAWQRSLGFHVEQLDPEEARRLEPALPQSMASVWFSPNLGALRLHRLTQAYAAAAARQGATVLPETPVVSFKHAHERITGVQLPDAVLATGSVVLATGAWSRMMGDTLGIAIPTRPVKGQLIAFADPPVRPSHVITGHGGYIVPRADGTVTAAATEEEAGFDRRVTGEGVQWLLDLAATLCPSLPAGELVQSWTGLRPATADGEPLMGQVPGFAGLWLAAGHFRTGAKEAPVSAQLVAESIVSGRIDPLLTPFLPAPERLSRAAPAVERG